MGLLAQSRARVGAPCLGAFLVTLLATSVPAGAAPKPIAGTLNKPGYTLIALAANGQARTVIALDGTFSIRPPARTVTLHLRTPDGTYGGPIVLAEKGKTVKRARADVVRAIRAVKRAKRQATRRLMKARARLKKARRLLRAAAARPNRAILGVKAGARLGRVSVNSAGGYALARGRHTRAWQKWLDTKRRAQAKRGVPIGAGNFGRVRSARSDGAAIGDLDRDGIPNLLDIDDDGDLILDELERSTGARASQAPPPPPGMDVFSQLQLDLAQTANANAPGSTDDQIAEAVSRGEKLLFSGYSPSTEIDCGGSPNPSPPPAWTEGLPYCTLGGTGIATSPGSPEFPECCDPDGDGFGTVPPGVGQDLPNTILAGTHQIETGDQLIGHLAPGGDVSQCPNNLNPACVSVTDVLQYVFATVPALVSYHDSAGNSATVSYPVPGPDPATGVCPPLGPPCSGPGTPQNPFPVAAGADGQVRVTLTVWRPQRKPISAEACLSDQPPCRWVDIGGLAYAVASGGSGPCFQSAYSEDDPTTPQVEDDPNLTLPTGPRVGLLGGLGFTDSRQPPDQPANPANKLTFTVNLTQCTSSAPWPSGETRGMRLFAVPTQGGGTAQQFLTFRHQ
jgi:hypothetical protein